MKKVLVACEESQAVTSELRKLGFDAYSCDIMQDVLVVKRVTEINTNKHCRAKC